MKKNILKLFTVAVITLSFQACSEWLSLQPTDRQTEGQIFVTKGGFYSALNGVYNSLGSADLYGQRLTWEMMDIITQRYVISSTNILRTQMANFNYSDGDLQAVQQRVWTTAYNTILNCNLLIKNSDLAKGGLLSDRDYAIIKGEALLIRAYLHFDMLRCFGPIYKNGYETEAIPYNTLSYASTLPILKANEVIEKALTDINEGVKLLSTSDPILIDGVLNTPRTENEQLEDIYRYRQLRMNYYAGLLLKARILLYAEEKEKALETALSIINDPKVSETFPFVNSATLLGNSATPDRVFSAEMFFGLYNQNRGLIFKNNFSPDGATLSLLQPRAGYIAGILFQNELQDYRYQSQWAASNAIGNTDPMFVKYMDITNNTLFHATVFPLLRLSEAYYIAAECETNPPKAYEYFNIMRVHRGVPEVNVVSRGDLDTRLANEYNREFAGEGQLFFYFKRKIVNIMAVNNGRNTSNYAMSVTRSFFPLPENEVSIR